MNGAGTEPRNHISPRFTNVPWANHDGRFSVLGRDGDKVAERSSGPTRWGAERGLYPPSVEEALSRVENLVAPVYRTLLNGQKLSADQRHVWSHWLVCQFTRTPGILLDIAGIPEQILGHLRLDSSLSAFPSSDNAIQSAIENVLSITGSMRLVVPIVLRDWFIYRAPTGTSFIKGDTPVALEGYLASDTARLVYPMSPELCFEAGILNGFPPTQIQTEFTISPQQVRELNQFIAFHAEREIICRHGDVSEELRIDAANYLGKSGPFLKVGFPPEWRP
jgi:hypothetical protein